MLTKTQSLKCKQIKTGISPYKTLRDMLNDDAMKKYIQSLNEQMLKRVQTSLKLC